MMLKTYSPNISPFLGMFKTTLKRNFGIMAIISVGVLLICPGYILSAENYYFQTAITMIELLSFTGLCSVLLFNFVNFSFLYKKPSADVFFALPIKRSGLIISRAVSGFIFSVIPIILGYIGIFIYNGFLDISVSELIFTSLFATLAFMAVCSAFSLVFVVSAGSGFDLALSFAGVNLGTIFCGTVLQIIFSNCLLGYPGNADNGRLSYFSPFLYFSSTLKSITNNTLKEGQLLSYYLVCLAMLLVFGALSLFLFKRRKCERGGDAYAFKFLFIICTLLISFSGGYLTGYIFSGNKLTPVLWVFAIVGALLIAIAYGAISNRSFKGLKSSIITAISSVMAMVIITVVATSGGLGYANYIPDAKDVERVEMKIDVEDIVFIDPTLPIKAHNEILQNGLGKNQKSFTTFFNITYHTKEGDSVKRLYFLNSTESEKLLKDLVFSNERFESTLQIIRESSDNENWIYVDAETNYQSIINKKERIALINIYKEELKNVKDLSALTVDTCQTYRIQYSGEEDINKLHNSQKARNITLIINDSFPKTKAYIKGLNLPDRCAIN